MDGLATEQIAGLLRWIKEGPAGAIPIRKAGKGIGRLAAVGWEDAGDRTAIDRLGRWHETAFSWFSEPFAVTPDGVRRWLVDQVLSDPHRLLFWVEDGKGQLRGHVGLTALDLEAGTATIGDVIPCNPAAAALVAAAVEALADWTRTELALEPVRASQARAVAA